LNGALRNSILRAQIHSALLTIECSLS
jgi:hypothetical protein